MAKLWRHVIFFKMFLNQAWLKLIFLSPKCKSIDDFRTCNQPSGWGNIKETVWWHSGVERRTFTGQVDTFCLPFFLFDRAAICYNERHILFEQEVFVCLDVSLLRFHWQRLLHCCWIHPWPCLRLFSVFLFACWALGIVLDVVIFL